jgi:serine protease AprX
MHCSPKIKKILPLIITFLSFNLNALICQNTVEKYIVYFNDKPTEKFDAYNYFTPKAIERKLLNQLPLYDWYDLPVNDEYLNQINPLVTKIKCISRWLNAAVIYADRENAEKIASLPFISSVEPQNSSLFIAETTEINDNPIEISRQTERMGIRKFDSLGASGKGILIAILDVGFSGADKHPAFEHIRKSNRIIKTFDFVKNTEDVYHGGSHGTSVWSCIAGKKDSIALGLATEANFLLARTEIITKEILAEEENWVMAAEWAHKNGADIINSSLGYTNARYFPENMNGKTALISRGASIAAKKGILVINAAGNDGDKVWETIAAPADADSVLTVGGVKPCCDYHINFSSFGPTSDLRLKPNVAAQGLVYCAKENGYGNINGTSFSSPLVAGFAACIWQQNKSLNNMEIFKLVEKSGNLFPYYDYAHGYGIPNSTNYLSGKNTTPTFDFIKPDVSNLQFYNPEEIFYKVTINDSAFTKDEFSGRQLLYYQIINTADKIENYFVLNVSQQEIELIPMSKAITGNKIRISYKNYFKEFKF